MIVIAYGKHPTDGFQVWSEDTPIAVFPPEYILKHEPPAGDVAQVETEFVEWTSFPAESEIEGVTVHDADGMHRITVEQTPDITVACSG